MARDLTSLATRYAGRPLLMAPRQAEEIARRIQAVDGQAFARPSRLGALLRKLSGGRPAPLAMGDDDEAEVIPVGERAAYAPYFIGDPDDIGFCWALKDGVALMEADTALGARGEDYCGVFYHGYDTLLVAMREALADARVKALFLRLESPGGVVAGGLPALATFMREARASAGGKPIWVYADMACSAAYWIAAQADRIIAPRVGLVGSLGAVMVLEDWSGALDKAGLKIESIEFPEDGFKTEGAWWKALSEEGRKVLLAEIAQCGRDFFADVVAGRPQLTVEQLAATRANVFMANHDDTALSGLSLGLVDAIADEETAFNELRDMVAGSPAKSSPAPGTSSAEASRGRASADTEKEAPVALKPKGASKAPTVAAARKALARAQADLVRAESAEAAEDADPDADGDDAVDETEASTDGDVGAMNDGDDEGEGQTEAQLIAASPEATANPALATAAIRDGLTLAQFKGMARAAQAGGGRGQLQSTLGNSPRLGADATGKASTDGLNAKAIYARRANRGQPARA